MSQTWLITSGAILLLVIAAQCLPNFMFGRPLHGFHYPLFRHVNELSAKADDNYTHLWFDQTLDHFTPSDSRTFKQRYHYNDKFYTAGGPQVLMLGGEGPENGRWAFTDTFSYFTWVKKYNASVFDLEHRFYGETRPFKNHTVENLKYLSSRQALADVATFIKAMNVKYNYTNPRWIVYGGSYSGALAVWFRELYPDVAIGAVGSSGPVQATLDFHEYLEDVEEALDAYPKCKQDIFDGFAEIGQLLWTEEGRTNLSSVFTLKPRLNNRTLRAKDIQYFYQAIVGNYMGSVQYNNDNTNGFAHAHGIVQVCNYMTNMTAYPSNLERIAAVNEYMTEFYTNAPFQYTDIDYDAYIAALQVDDYSYGDSVASMRNWVWQTCTEFAYFQTTDYGGSTFGSAMPLNMYTDMCIDIFGPQFTAEAIQNNVHATNVLYGGKDHYYGTNAVFLYGTVDPWHKLGRYLDSDPSVVYYLINGTAHCSEMYPESANDVPGLKVARQIIMNNVDRWLSGVPALNRTSANQMQRKEQPRRPLKPFTSAIKEVEGKPYTEAPMKTVRKPKRVGRLHSLKPEPPAQKDVNDTLISGTITQPVDNFDPRNPDTYQQRYWINEKYYKAGGPQFLMIEGESVASQRWITTEVQIYVWARNFNAMLFQLEHRFYGGSQPFPKNMSSAAMKYLTTEQALADTARFIMTMNTKYKFDNPKWVTFGGSYPGALSAWFREKYPELTVGAVASSAPVEIKVDFFEYLIVADRSIRRYNNTCGDYIKKGFDDMAVKAQSPDGRVELSQLFGLQPNWTAASVVTTRDIQYFFQYVYDKFQDVVQYNNDNTGRHANGGGIKEACSIMLNVSLGTEVQRVAAVVKYVVQYYEDVFNYQDNNYWNYVHDLQIEDYHDENASYVASSWRGWNYQCCVEIGYLQSTDISSTTFGSVTPVDFWINLCEDVFGKDFVPARGVYKTVEAAQAYYGGRDYFKATNIVFANGRIDPWHALSVTEAQATDSLIVLFHNETAHCGDMYPSRSEDPPGLAELRDTIAANIQKWINAPGPTQPPGGSTTGPATETQSTGASTTGPATGTQSTGASTTGPATETQSTGASTTGPATGTQPPGASTTTAAKSSTLSHLLAVLLPLAFVLSRWVS